MDEAFSIAGHELLAARVCWNRSSKLTSDGRTAIGSGFGSVG
jgi:hypothetical protein